MAGKKEKRTKTPKVKEDPLSGLKQVLKYVLYGVLSYFAFFGLRLFGPKLAQKWEDFRSDVVVLTESNFDAAIAANKEILVEFYAPWCGHCKRLKPEYEIAATRLKAHSLKIAKVDCTTNQDLCQKQDVTGYPTLKVFTDGEPAPYGGGHTADAIVAKMLHEVTSQPVPAEQGDNKMIVAKNFDDLVMNSDADVFIKFYAPWCGHCKAMAPAWEEFATNQKSNSNLVVGEFDATANDIVHPALKDMVKGYPSLVWLPKGDKENPVKYSGGRTLEDFEKWVQENGAAGSKEEL